MITRDEMAARADEWRARKDEIQQRFAENVDTQAAETAIGLSLVGAGVGTVIASLIRGRRSPWAYVVPAIFILGGLAFVGSGVYNRRAERITQAEEFVRVQLADLDPIARAQVLKGVASETFAPIIRHSAN